MVAVVLLCLGGAIAGVNFFLSFLAAPLHRLRYGRSPERVPSGVPLLGSLFLAGAMSAVPSGSAAQMSALVLLAADTGGPHWFLASHIWRRWRGGRRGFAGDS